MNSIPFNQTNCNYFREFGIKDTNISLLEKTSQDSPTENLKTKKTFTGNSLQIINKISSKIFNNFSKKRKVPLLLSSAATFGILSTAYFYRTSLFSRVDVVDHIPFFRRIPSNLKNLHAIPSEAQPTPQLKESFHHESNLTDYGITLIKGAGLAGLAFLFWKCVEFLNQRYHKKDEQHKLKTTDYSGLEKMPNVTIYSQGNKTIPITKKAFASGTEGSVHTIPEMDTLVVKKSTYNELFAEFMIGSKLRHPNLCKSYHLYVKELDTGFKHKMTMEKIEGTLLQDVKELTNEQVITLLSQLKDCCSYLNKEHYIWKDLHQGNVFITKEGLKLFDFGYWVNETDSLKRMKGLLLGAIQLNTGIILQSKMYTSVKNAIIKQYLDTNVNLSNLDPDDPMLDRVIKQRSETSEKLKEEEQKVLWPIVYPKSKSIFPEGNQDLSYIDSKSDYNDSTLMKNLLDTFEKKNDIKRGKFLQNYFQAVIDEFNQSLQTKPLAAAPEDNISKEVDTSQKIEKPPIKKTMLTNPPQFPSLAISNTESGDMMNQEPQQASTSNQLMVFTKVD